MVGLGITMPDCNFIFIRCDLGDVLLSILVETKEPRSVSPGTSLTEGCNPSDHNQKKASYCLSPEIVDYRNGKEESRKMEKDPEGGELTNLQLEERINQIFNQAIKEGAKKGKKIRS